METFAPQTTTVRTLTAENTTNNTTKKQNKALQKKNMKLRQQILDKSFC